MTGDDIDRINRVKRLVLTDPAVKAAADQLKAAGDRPPPGMTAPDWDDGQLDAMRLIMDITIRRGADELGISAEEMPGVLEYVARSLEEHPLGSDPGASSGSTEPIRHGLVAGLARIDHILELADNCAEAGEDMTIVKQQATAARAQIVATLAALDRRDRP